MIDFTGEDGGLDCDLGTDITLEEKECDGMRDSVTRKPLACPLFC